MFPSAPGGRHELGRITFSFDLDRCSGLLDLVEIVAGEFDVGSVQVLLQAAEVCGTWDRDDPGLLCQQPGQRDLRRRGLLALADPLEEITLAPGSPSSLQA